MKPSLLQGWRLGLLEERFCGCSSNSTRLQTRDSRFAVRVSGFASEELELLPSEMSQLRDVDLDPQSDKE